MGLVGDQFRAGVGVTNDVITLVVTLRDVSWLIEGVTGALALMTNPENWTDEFSEGLIENATDFASELCESITVMDRIGEVNAYVVSSVLDLPLSVLPCNGTTYNADDYPLLFARLPASLKAETTFTTPDLRGRTIIGAGTGLGLTTRVIATALGEEMHLLSEAEIPPHTHSYTPPILNVDLEAPGVPDVFAAGVGPLPVQTSISGGGAAHNNMQPSFVLIWGVIAR